MEGTEEPEGSSPPEPFLSSGAASPEALGEGGPVPALEEAPDPAGEALSPPPPSSPPSPSPSPSAQEQQQQQPRKKQQGVKRHHHKHNLKHRYELQETLGKGTYGKVKRATERFSGRVVAIKSIRKDKIKDEQDMVHIRREIEIMSSLSHPHIITIYEACRKSIDWCQASAGPIHSIKTHPKWEAASTGQ